MYVSGLTHLLSGVSCKNFSGKCLIQKCCLAMLLFACCLFSGVLCDDSAPSSVTLGFQIHAFDGDKNWVSENGVFAFGFLEVAGHGGGDEFVVGINYNLGDKSVNVPVWAVGGGHSVSVNSTFSLAMDGRLVLMNNPSGIILWSSNTSGLGVQKATLLDNGNLVLLSSKGDVLWESFSSPTDTLLPGQSLRYPMSLRALSTRELSSYYSLVISQSGELQLAWQHNVTYWRSRFSSKEARFESTGVFSLYNDRNLAVWSASPNDYEDSSVKLRHLRIDRDGNLRIYSWDEKSHVWKGVWQAVQDQCNVFGSCGPYSVCGYNSSGPVCDCLASDSSEMWMNSPDVDSGGSRCKRLADLGNCRMHTSMFIMKQTVLYGLYPSHDDEMLLSEAACRDYCSEDPTCIASTSMNDGSGRCTIKRTSSVSGYKTPNIRAVSFLKACLVPQAVPTHGAIHPGNDGLVASASGPIVGRPTTKTLVAAIGLIALLTVSVVLSVQILLFWLLYQRRKHEGRTRIPFGKDAQMNPHYSVLIRLSFDEIKELTNDFVDPLGTSVFKGVLPNKARVVAKLLQDVAVSEKEFRVTVSTLSGTHHRNLVSLKGFCYEPANKVLIYEYIPNGSLDKWLFNAREDGNEHLWQQNLNIVLGVARAIAYLHTECQKCITHGNIKLENILLDENMAPKVTNFGLEDFVVKKAASSSEAPSERDIYMLGLIFLQIVTRKREVAGENMQKILEEMINQDQKFMGSDSLQAIERITRISFWCMQDQPFLRPSIGEVVKVLEGTLSVDRPPSRSGRKHLDIESETEIEEEC